MKKQILEALKAKFEGVSDAILNRIADKLAKTVTKEEDVASSVEGVTLQQVLESYGDSRASEAADSAISTYEKKHGLKEGAKVNGGGESSKGKPNEPEKKETEDDKDTPAWAKTLIAQNEAMQKRMDAIEGEKVTDVRTKRFNEVIANVPDTQKGRLTKDFERLKKTFEDEDDFEAYITDLGTDVEAIIGASEAKGATGYSAPKGGGNAKQPDKAAPEVLARVEARKGETVASPIQGLPATK